MGTYDDEDSQEDRTYGNFNVKGDRNSEEAEGGIDESRRRIKRRRISGAPQGGGGGGRGGGLLISIGIIVVLNVLSQVFDWGWVFY